MKIKEIYDFLISLAPLENQMDFDNCGLLVGGLNETVSKALLALDVTEEVVLEAEKIGAELIISHHPVIFKPLKRLELDSVAHMLSKRSINALCLHTNLDVAPVNGVNACLADALSLKNVEPLSIYKETSYKKIVVFIPEGYEDKVYCAASRAGAGNFRNYHGCSFRSSGIGTFIPKPDAKPFIGKENAMESVKETKMEFICPKGKIDDVISKIKEVHPYEEPAFDVYDDDGIKETLSLGLVGDLPRAMGGKEFARYVKEKLGCEGVRYSETDKTIERVAVSSGAGGESIEDAIKANADAFVTGEIKHHLILRANSAGVQVVDAGHFKTEDAVIDRLVILASSRFSNVKFYKSKKFTDKIKYV